MNSRRTAARNMTSGPIAEPQKLFWLHSKTEEKPVPYFKASMMPPERKKLFKSFEKTSNFGTKNNERFEEALGKSPYVREYRFCLHRKWRVDYCYYEHQVAIEWDGGIYFKKSGHNTAKGIMDDNEKRTMANILGWRVFVFNPGSRGFYNTLLFLQEAYGIEGFNFDLPLIE